MPCLKPSWSCLDWCKKLCKQEPLVYSVDQSIGAARVKQNNPKVITQLSESKAVDPKQASLPTKRQPKANVAARKKTKLATAKKKFRRKKVEKARTVESAPPKVIEEGFDMKNRFQKLANIL